MCSGIFKYVWQASEEQLRIASRIGESHNIPSDIKRKIQQVTAIVPNKSEDEICIMLHDNNFDPEAAISALLDNDSSDVKVWLHSLLCVKPIISMYIE